MIYLACCPLPVRSNVSGCKAASGRTPGFGMLALPCGQGALRCSALWSRTQQLAVFASLSTLKHVRRSRGRSACVHAPTTGPALLGCAYSPQRPAGHGLAATSGGAPPGGTTNSVRDVEAARLYGGASSLSFATPTLGRRRMAEWRSACAVLCMALRSVWLGNQKTSCAARLKALLAILPCYAVLGPARRSPWASRRSLS